MGTPDFAVPILRRLHDAAPDHGWQIVAAATQPDRPAGRGKQLAPVPVKRWRWNRGFPCCSRPACARTRRRSTLWRALAPDLIVVAAYGLILPRERAGDAHLWLHQRPCQPAAWPTAGASPITAAILDGAAETGC